MHAPIEFFAYEWLRSKEMPWPAPPCPTSPCPASPGAAQLHRPAGAPTGFTLIELLVVLAITAVLAAIAVPTYADYLRRGRITEALMRLSDHRVRMEQFFLDQRRYDDGAGRCGYAPPPADAADAFALECTAAAARYVVRATGRDAKGMRGFVYTIDQANARRTPAVPDGWVASDRCWVVRRDGSCG